MIRNQISWLETTGSFSNLPGRDFQGRSRLCSLTQWKKVYGKVTLRIHLPRCSNQLNIARSLIQKILKRFFNVSILDSKLNGNLDLVWTLYGTHFQKNGCIIKQNKRVPGNYISISYTLKLHFLLPQKYGPLFLLNKKVQLEKINEALCWTIFKIFLRLAVKIITKYSPNWVELLHTSSSK